MDRKRLYIVLFGLFLLCSFYVFSREINLGFFKQVDFNTTVRIQNKIPQRFDELWEDMVFFVTPVSSIIIVGLLTILGLMSRGIRVRALIIPVLFGLLVLGEIYGKNVVHHPAPPFFMIKNPTTIFPKYYINEQYSYPSGHTARATFLSVVLFSLVKRKRTRFAIGLGVFVAVVAIGRIYLGHHWLSDIIGGVLLGGGFGLLTLSVVSPIISEQ